MKSLNIPRIMLSGTSSGGGKTTVTCAVLQALKNRAMNVISYKCGPDYIDPMFHSKVIGTSARNLDCFFTAENVTRFLFAHAACKSSADIAIIEGVMGHYDGIGGTTTAASAYELSQVIALPVILILDCKGMSTSLGAMLKGFMEYRHDSGIKGVILNRVSPMLYPLLKQNLEAEFPVKVCGYLPLMPDCSLESRHLGLITASEVTDLKDKLQKLAVQAEKSIDIDALITIAEAAGELTYKSINFKPVAQNLTIAVANDDAFCFSYEDNLDLLRELGADIRFFSPILDSKLPENTAGIILPGGYPELHTKALSENKSMLSSIKNALDSGIPCIAECGGFMYISSDLDGFKMVSAIDSNCTKKDKLQRFGYITLTALCDNLLCHKGEKINAHEFHYYDSTQNGDAFSAQKPVRNTSWNCVHANENIFAGFPHLYFYSNPKFAVNFMKKCLSRKEFSNEH